MQILVFNGGSSSLIYEIFDVKGPDKFNIILRGKAHRVGVKGTKESYIENNFQGKTEKTVIHIPDHKAAVVLASYYIRKYNIKIDCIGNRFVHGGTYFKKSALINKDSLKKLEACLSLAPLHNPISLSIIKEAGKLFPSVPQYVVFDSAFHAHIPLRAYLYSLPKAIRDKYQFRKYGFHGISYTYISKKIPEFLRSDPKKFKMIACHLGTGGASVAAIKNGLSIDTSMGFSPLSGLIMSTRSGDIDPMLILYLMKESGYSAENLIELLNKKSGLLGISGFSSDITDIMERISNKKFQKRAILALNMYLYRLKKYIGSYILALGGKIDALVFTDDVGVNNPFVREAACKDMAWAGIAIDKEKNKRASSLGISLINSFSSKVKVVSVPTQEEYIICLEGMRILEEKE